MVSWSTLQTLIFLFGPLVLPKLIGIARSVRIRNTQIKPVGRRLKVGLGILAAVLILALISSLTYFQDENIISATGARLLLTPNDVLMRRLETLRHRQGIPKLSENDVTLLDALQTREGRLLYAAYGPRPLIECSWCTLSDPTSYLYYAIPTIALPHIANIAILGVVTSSLFSKSAGSLRIHATITGLGVAMGEILLIYNFEIIQNTQAARPIDVNWFYWRLLTYRGIAIAVVNFIFSMMLYLTATGRYGSIGISDLEKIEAISKTLEVGLAHVRTSLFIKSTATRNDSISMDILEFWKKEGMNRRVVAEQLETTRNLVIERVDLDSINDEAFKFTSNLIDAIASQKAAAAVD
ncbi:hypothetical protein H072_1094 [Dactylellina haptotyla CBS 200.50]|uniref:Uncharacterized protein n=1 Tax=Dactylellina haptotyla (strain CBS 200.50) TaxID=1284197 RepID=S8BZN6_DACHA|nr:hypothetical protein H072_1094 [Dactylellina haptotyla CBS 200.50]